MRLEGKVAIVTGSSRGIGKAIALAMAREGAAVVVAARSEETGRLPGNIRQTAAEIQALGGRALALRTDVTREEEVEAMVQRTLEAFGQIDILVNNAGIVIYGPLVQMPIRRWDLVLNVNLRGTFLCTRAVLPHMMQRRRGCIINISSWYGRTPSPNGIAYSVSKAGIEYLSLGLAEEVKEYNIAVNVLSPGAPVDTEGARFWDPEADRSGWESPELMAEAAVFLATRDVQSLTGKYIISSEWKRLQAF